MFNNSSTGTQVLLVLASLTVVIAGLKAASSIVVPLLMAIFLAIISAAMLQWLQRRGLPLWAAMTLVLLLLASTLVTLGSLIGASINQFSSALPRYEAQLNALITQTTVWLGGLGIKLPAGGVTELFDPAGAAKLLGRLLSGFGGLLANSLLIILTVLFLMVESTSLPEKLRSISRNPDKTLGDLAAFMASVNHYLVIKAVMSLITGLAIALYLVILGIDFAIIWGSLAFFMNFAVKPDALPDEIFRPIGRVVWHDIGSVAIGFRMLLKIFDYGFFATFISRLAHTMGDYKKNL